MNWRRDIRQRGRRDGWEPGRESLRRRE
eukprot:SAG22_NODE_13544_length_403_cov_0.578947_1_plen_27_part_01